MDQILESLQQTEKLRQFIIQVIEENRLSVEGQDLSGYLQELESKINDLNSEVNELTNDLSDTNTKLTSLLSYIYGSSNTLTQEDLLQIKQFMGAISLTKKEMLKELQKQNKYDAIKYYNFNQIKNQLELKRIKDSPISGLVSLIAIKLILDPNMAEGTYEISLSGYDDNNFLKNSISDYFFNTPTGSESLQIKVTRIENGAKFTFSQNNNSKIYEVRDYEYIQLDIIEELRYKVTLKEGETLDPNNILNKYFYLKNYSADSFSAEMSIKILKTELKINSLNYNIIQEIKDYQMNYFNFKPLNYKELKVISTLPSSLISLSLTLATQEFKKSGLQKILNYQKIGAYVTMLLMMNLYLEQKFAEFMAEEVNESELDTTPGLSDLTLLNANGIETLQRSIDELQSRLANVVEYQEIQIDEEISAYAVLNYPPPYNASHQSYGVTEGCLGQLRIEANESRVHFTINVETPKGPAKQQMTVTQQIYETTDYIILLELNAPMDYSTVTFDNDRADQVPYDCFNQYVSDFQAVNAIATSKFHGVTTPIRDSFEYKMITPEPVVYAKPILNVDPAGVLLSNVSLKQLDIRLNFLFKNTEFPIEPSTVTGTINVKFMGYDLSAELKEQDLIPVVKVVIINGEEKQLYGFMNPKLDFGNYIMAKHLAFWISRDDPNHEGLITVKPHLYDDGTVTYYQNHIYNYDSDRFARVKFLATGDIDTSLKDTQRGIKLLASDPGIMSSDQQLKYGIPDHFAWNCWLYSLTLIDLKATFKYKMSKSIGTTNSLNYSNEVEDKLTQEVSAILETIERMKEDIENLERQVEVLEEFNKIQILSQFIQLGLTVTSELLASEAFRSVIPKLMNKVKSLKNKMAKFTSNIFKKSEKTLQKLFSKSEDLTYFERTSARQLQKGIVIEAVNYNMSEVIKEDFSVSMGKVNESIEACNSFKVLSQRFNWLEEETVDIKKYINDYNTVETGNVSIHYTPVSYFGKAAPSLYNTTLKLYDRVPNIIKDKLIKTSLAPVHSCVVTEAVELTEDSLIKNVGLIGVAEQRVFQGQSNAIGGIMVKKIYAGEVNGAPLYVLGDWKDSIYTEEQLLEYLYQETGTRLTIEEATDEDYYNIYADMEAKIDNVRDNAAIVKTSMISGSQGTNVLYKALQSETAFTYDLLRNNCQTVSNQIFEYLTNGEYPSFLTPEQIQQIIKSMSETYV